MNKEFIAEFRNTVLQAYAELQAISVTEAAAKASAEQWSIKELIGHLLDSASNNHQRIVRLQIFEEIEFPYYQQDEFVSVNHYQAQSWEALLTFWKSYNLHLVHLVENLDAEKLNHIWHTPDGKRLTLEFIVTDYLKHLRHHLAQVNTKAAVVIA